MRTIISTLLLFVANLSFSQNLQDNFYVKTLQEELNRNIRRLQLPDLQKPFLISYTLQTNTAYTIRAERGQIVSYEQAPRNSKIALVKLRVGDYHRNFDYQLPGGSYIALPEEDNADEIRRILWMETDRAYKSIAQQYNGILTNLKRITVDEKDLALDDLAKITPVVKDFGSPSPLEINIPQWKNLLSYLSSLFNAYPELTNSYCQLSVRNAATYLVTSEGAIVREPVQNATLYLFASTTDDKGVPFSDSYRLVATELSEMPNKTLLEKEVKNLIQNVLALKNSPKFEDYYMGPVLFEGEVAAQVFNDLFNRDLHTRRKDLWRGSLPGTDYESKLGQKLVAGPLTVVAIPSLKVFQGKKATGAYSIDYEGVIPPDSLILIKNGILKSLMNGRTPTPKFKVSQGFAQSPNGQFYSSGVLKVSSDKTIAADSIKQQLLTLAKEEGLNHAFIAKKRGYDGTLWLYKVSTATGTEELVNSCDITNFNIRNLRRFITATDQLELTNLSEDQSVVAPRGIILNEIEIEKKEGWANQKPIIVSNPLLDRQATTAPKKTSKRK